MYLLLLKAFPFNLLQNLVRCADEPGLLSLVTAHKETHTNRRSQMICYSIDGVLPAMPTHTHVLIDTDLFELYDLLLVFQLFLFFQYLCFMGFHILHQASGQGVRARHIQKAYYLSNFDEQNLKYSGALLLLKTDNEGTLNSMKLKVMK